MVATPPTIVLAVDAWVWPLAALAGGAIGAFAAGEQWRLYSEEVHRSEPLSGRRLWVARALVGLASAAVAGLAFRPDHYEFGPALLTAAFGMVLVVLSSTDFERRRLPNRLMYPALIAAGAFCWAWPDRSAADIGIGFAVAGGIALGLYLLGAAFGAMLGVSETPFGFGDVKLIALEGLLLGWSAVLSALFLGVLLAGVPALVMILMGGAKKTFSYGPYLAAGCLVVLLFYDRVG